ncbi:MAG: hypothetical protein H0V44_08545, partial [Planctomycetes bacterium]|nr:hypothetical protein [Planctomycetota bacterium]
MKTDTRFRIGRKLMLISLFFLIPDSLMLYLVITRLNADIGSARLEVHGNRYQRPLERLLALIPEHHALSTVPNADAGALKRVTAEIDRTFVDLSAIDAELGGRLDFTAEGLAKRGRGHANAAALATSWRELVSDPGPIDGHRELIGAVRTMITHAGDQSNLILDPELDTYYLMDVTLLALPQTQDRLAAILARWHGATPAELTASERAQLHVDVALLREADLARVLASANACLQEDAGFHGTSPSLQERLPPMLAEYRARTRDFIDLAAGIASSPSPVDAARFVAAGSRARAASFALWEVASQELDVLLNARISHLWWVRFFSLMAAAVTVVAAIAIVTFITRSITLPLARQAAKLATANRELTAEIAERSRVEAQLRHAQKM